MQNKGKYYITTAIAYTSGKPHIGNSYEIVLADSIARYKRADGYDVYFQTGIYIWDVAAARLICERAGGRCDVLARRGGYRMALLGTNGNPVLADTLRVCAGAAGLA